MPSPIWTEAQRVKARAVLKARHDALPPIPDCPCGKPGWIRKWALCQACYHVAWKRDAL